MASEGTGKVFKRTTCSSPPCHRRSRARFAAAAHKRWGAA